MKIISSSLVFLTSICVATAAQSGNSDPHSWPQNANNSAISSCRKAPARINFSIRKNNVIDLTYTFNEDSSYWPTLSSGFQLVNVIKDFVLEPAKYFLYMNTFTQPEHTGTHMDAPSHFQKNGNGAGEVSLHDLIGTGVLLNMKKEGKRFEGNSLVTTNDFLLMEKETGRQIRTGDVVLIYTGYGETYYDREKYFGTNLTGSEAVPHISLPGLAPEAAEWLVKERCISAIGIDTASIDYGRSPDFRSHQILSASGIPIFENVANLDKIAERERRFKVIALPQKIEGGSGAPLRIIAVLA